MADATVEQLTPALTDLGAQLRAYTKDTSGTETGTFGAGTRPTGTEATDLIAQVFPIVRNKAGATIPVELAGQFKSVVVLATALRVGISYFPEQITTGRFPFQQIKDLLDQEWADFMEALTDMEDTGQLEADGPGTGSGYPSYGGFPTTAIGMEFPW